MFPIDAAGKGSALLDRIVTHLLDPVVKVVFTLGLLMFFVGLVQFLWGLKDGKVDQAGKDHMVWGMVGMLIMVSVYGIIAIIMNTVGINPSDAVDISRVRNVDPGVNFFGR